MTRLCQAAEIKVETAGAAYAPMDVSKRSDPAVPLSTSQRLELLGEFKGLVHMGMRKATVDEWEGKEMADCEKPTSEKEHWKMRCEIITGQANAYYYFYPSESHPSGTLQELDVRVEGSDEHLLDDFRRPVQELFGRATFKQYAAIPAKPSGPVRHWDNGNEMAELFIDHSVRPEGSVRFIWTRSPFVEQDISSR